MQLYQDSHYLEHYIACPCCGVIHNIPVNKHADVLLVCGTCNTEVYKHKERSTVSIFILSLSGLILFVPVMSLPLLKVSIGSMENGASIFQSVFALYKTHPLVSIVSSVLAVFFPLAYLLLVNLVSALTLRRKGVYFRKKALLFLSFLEHWYMLDVFMISVFVTLIKLTGDLTVHFGVGFYLLIIMGGLIILTDYYLFLEDLWGKVENES